MVCDGQYKLIWCPPIDQYLLYDMKNDPKEMEDLAGEAEYSDILQRLKIQLSEILKEYRDPLWEGQ